jgi:hypothetical protein
MRAVIYKPLPGAPGSGAIVQTIEALQASVISTAAMMGASWAAVPSDMGQAVYAQIDRTHHVVEGALVRLPETTP